MRLYLNNWINNRRNILQAIGCAVLVTAVFSWRWFNCLPFSGYMPTLSNFESVGYFGRALIYMREPLGLPLGIIRGLSFPFIDTANIMRGPIPLFAIPLKILSKIYPPVAEYYYFVLVEILSSFFSALFAWGLVREFNARSFWTKLLAASLGGLSVIMLQKSSQYYGVSFLVMFVPLYLGCAYFYVRLYKYRNWKNGVMLAGIFICAAMTDYYIIVGMGMGLSICIVIHVLEMLFRRKQRKHIFVRILPILIVLLVSFFTSLFMQGLIGNNRNFDKVDSNILLANRYASSWGYGGGFGGGFHVADALSIIIPPKDDENLPKYRRLGPTAYLARLGFPITTADLQAGQYEGFAYAGTVPLGLWLAIIVAGIVTFFRKPRMFLTRLRLQVFGQLHSATDNSLLLRAMGVSAIILYFISWGYVIHIGGHRIYNILTPSFMMASLMPEFMLARSIGRFAIPLSIFVVLCAVTLFERHVGVRLYETGKRGRIIFAILVVALIVAHVSEVSGYLRQSGVTRGNEIAKTFSEADVAIIKKIVRGKVAIMIVPAFVGNMEWTMVSYSLAFHGKIPISGSTMGPPAESAETLLQYNRDVSDILAGKLRDIVKRYGNICIACPSEIARKILENADLPLKAHRLLSRDCVILTLV